MDNPVFGRFGVFNVNEDVITSMMTSSKLLRRHRVDSMVDYLWAIVSSLYQNYFRIDGGGSFRIPAFQNCKSPALGLVFHK